MRHFTVVMSFLVKGCNLRTMCNNSAKDDCELLALIPQYRRVSSDTGFFERPDVGLAI